MDNSKINILYDQALISDVIYRYATGVDNKDWELFRTALNDPVNATSLRSACLPASFRRYLDLRGANKTGAVPGDAAFVET